MGFAGIFLLVFVISSISIFLLTPLAIKFHLVDIPNSERKFHQGDIPLIGGVSMYAGLVMGVSLFIAPSSSSLTYFVCSSIIVALGVIDDVRELSPRLRLFVQMGVAALMCAYGGTHIHYLGTMFGTSTALVLLEPFGYVVTGFAVLAAINAFNMIDGIDGLLGVSSLVIFASMGLLFYQNNDIVNMKLTLILVGALIPYLIANLAGGVQEKHKRISKIFMGDTGSMLIGFTVVWLLIQGTQPPLAVSTDGVKVGFSAAIALWLIAFPLMDMVRVIIDRALQGRSPFKADRTHLHHILLACGDTKQMALLKISTLSAFFAVAGITMHSSGLQEVTVFLIFLAAFAIYTVRVRHLQKKLAQ